MPPFYFFDLSRTTFIYFFYLWSKLLRNTAIFLNVVPMLYGASKYGEVKALIINYLNGGKNGD